MSSLKNLFGLQKIAGNEKLDKVISDTHSRYDDAELLSEDELELAAAGRGVAQYMDIACPACGTINKVDISKDTATCSKCKKKIEIFG